MRVLRGIELRGRDGRHAQLHDQEPAELEITRAVGHVRGKVVVRGEDDFGEVGEDEVAAFGVGVLLLGLDILVPRKPYKTVVG